jgi:hypothetical protein
VAQQYFYTSDAVQTSLSASLGAVSAGSTGQTVQVASISGWPTQFPAPMLLEWGTVNQERVTLTQAATGSGPYTFANCIRGDDGTAAPAHSAGAGVWHGVTAVDYFQIAPVYNVCAYGADPTNAVDSTTSIQNAINAAHTAGAGMVALPKGSFKLSSALTLYAGISLIGAGSAATTINQTGTSANGITATDLTGNTIQGITLNGPGSGTGKGIYSTLSVLNNQQDLTFRDLMIVNFGGTGLELLQPVASTFQNVTTNSNLGHGFYIHGNLSGGAAGTSCSFISCYANTNSLIGYWINNMTYCAFDGCAADSNGVGYQIDTSECVTLNGCGAEQQLAQNGYDGTSFKITGSNNVVLNAPWTYDQGAVMVWVTGGSQAVTLLSVDEHSPAAGATASIKTDAGTMTTLAGYLVTKPLSLAANTVNVLNDGSTGQVSLAGSLGLAQSTSAQTLSNGNTITTTATGVARVSASGTITGIILGAGTYAGQLVTVLNEGSGTLAFNTTPGTAHVADSATEPAIAALTARQFIWDSSTSLWYRTA